jgi:hypothetical protein
MNKYTISLPKDYPCEEALLHHLKQKVSEYDTYLFERSDVQDRPQCILVKPDPDFVFTVSATGQQFCTDGRHVDEAIEEFETERTDLSNNTDPQ